MREIRTFLIQINIQKVRGIMPVLKKGVWMNLSISRPGRQKIFIGVVVCSLALAIAYTSWVIRRADTGANQVQAQGQEAPLSTQGANEDQVSQKEPHLLFVEMVESYGDQVKLQGLDPVLPERAPTGLICERVYYAAGNGVCLKNASAGLDHQVSVTLFGADFKPRHQFTTEGILSRARVSPDGKYAAFTVFLAGHSYADAELSTATVILETATGTNLGNLEEFEVWKDGRPYDAPEFNFWGVTFGQDSNRFYATLQHLTKIYLVQGDVAARTLTVLYENVACPSLSPDGTRIAYKKSTPQVFGQLTVLDLATMKETQLAETYGIDDQVEWLDNENILYHKLDYDPPKLVSVFVLPADGSGKPEVFIENAMSPVVVR
jgi:Tol biopolymer transport system component